MSSVEYGRVFKAILSPEIMKNFGCKVCLNGTKRRWWWKGDGFFGGSLVLTHPLKRLIVLYKVSQYTHSRYV